MRPGIFWLDLILSAAIGWTLFFVSAHVERGGPHYLFATSGAVLAQLRALVFLHEIAHRRRIRFFESVWNVLVGVPMCVPSIMYVGSHLDHHRVDCFATRQDPEYAPISEWSRARRGLFVLGSAFVPVLLAMRWGLLGPLRLLLGGSPRFVVAACSTLAINPRYERRMTAHASARWLVLEPLSAAFVWLIACAAFLGWISPDLVAQWFVVVGGVFVVNQLRTLVAHGYDNFGIRLDLEGQLIDSVNLTRSPVTALVAPLGLRYHALHHLVPELPYHSLGRVHRELLARLPKESPYRRTEYQGVTRALRMRTADA